MKPPRRLALCRLALLVTVLTPGAAQAEDWRNAFQFESRPQAQGLALVLTAKPGYYVNSAYPIKLRLSAPGLDLSKAELRKADAEFVSAGHSGKAKKATFTVKVVGDGLVQVAYKISICTMDGCSPPMKGNFSARYKSPPVIAKQAQPKRAPRKTRPRPKMSTKEVRHACAHPGHPGSQRRAP